MLGNAGDEKAQKVAIRTIKKRRGRE